MFSATTLSLDGLHQAIAALDPGQVYRRISYEWAANNILDNPQWWAFIPYGNWPPLTPPYPPLTPPNPSPFETAVLKALSPDATYTGDTFIDLSHLDASDPNFFKDPKANRTIIASLQALLQDGTRKATIRYLIGDQGSVAPQNDGFLSTLFSLDFPNKDNVAVYFGNFAPDFAPQSSAVARKMASPDMFGGIWSWLHDLIADIERIGGDVAALLREVEADIRAWIERFLASTIPTFSWNHSKIVAVNGRKLVTGGANYWGGYTTGQTWLFDFGMAIEGDAALAGHRFLNYLWSYVGNRAPTDNSSYCLGNVLSNPIGDFAPTQAPAFNLSPQSPGKLATLAVARSGMWPHLEPAFSIQMFDAVRDFVGNLIAVVAETRFGDKGDIVTAFVADRLGDDDPAFRALLTSLGVSPAAWATRYARNYAVARAQRVLRFTQQKFVMNDLVTQSQQFQNLVSDINSRLKIQWDGYFWPLDTMLALGYALSTFSRNAAPVPALQIVCSYFTSDPTEGYQDAVSSDTFKNRLIGIMRGMKALNMIDPAGDPGAIVDQHCAYKRISSDGTTHANHAKVAVIDDALCFVGSDNAYPSYNAEFGLWNGDQSSIQAFVDDYWTELWQKVPIDS